MPAEGENPDQAASQSGAAIMIEYANDIRFNNCEVSATGNNAIWFKTGCSNSSVKHCYLHDLGIGGLKLGDTRKPESKEDITHFIIADNNIIRSGGYEIPTGVGIIIFHASNNTISHNEIADFKYSGVSAGWVWGYTPSVAKRNKIIYNHIHHLGWGQLSDMGGVYTLGQSQGTIVANNVIHDIYSYGYGGWGLYTDEGSTGIIMENNLVYRCKSSAFHQHYGKDNLIKNNIFALNKLSELQATRIEDHLSFTFTNNIIYFNSGTLLGTDHGGNWGKVNIITDRNIYWDTRTRNIMFDHLTFKEWQSLGKDRNSFIINPLFTDAENGNFSIKNLTSTRKIGFKPFDFYRAGVYGSEDWKEKAILDKAIIKEFDFLLKTIYY